MTDRADPPERLAVIGDIHGNADALAAVLADIDRQGIDTILNTGDHFSGPLDAAGTADLLLSRSIISVCGNHDRWLVETPSAEMGASDAVAFERLAPAHLDWLRSLPPTIVPFDGIFMCHGTPTSDTTYWLEQVSPDGTVSLRDRAAVEREAIGVPQSLILCGHTHLPRIVHLADGRTILNPGSVGAPGYDDDRPVPHVMQTGTPDACYAVVEREDGGWRIAFHHVPYDTARMVDLARRADRPEWAAALATGWVTPLS